MKRNDKADAIVEILEAYEESLSDGYSYYCGYGNREKILVEIANKIITLLEKAE